MNACSDMAEKKGFEPLLRSTRTTPLAGEPLRPLGYFSKPKTRAHIGRRIILSHLSLNVNQNVSFLPKFVALIIKRERANQLRHSFFQKRRRGYEIRVSAFLRYGAAPSRAGRGSRCAMESLSRECGQQSRRSRGWKRSCRRLHPPQGICAWTRSQSRRTWHCTYCKRAGRR